MTITLDVREEGEQLVLTPSGDWVGPALGAVDGQLRRLEDTVEPGKVVLDLNDLGAIDTSGAFALGRVLNRCAYPDDDFHFVGEHPAARRLMQLAREKMAPCPPPPATGSGVLDLFERAGRGLMAMLDDIVASFAFFGEMLAALGRGLANPSRIRWASVVHVMESAGLNAIPIVATLSFFVGAVLAYLGANILQIFNASVFAVELVAFAVLREFGAVLTAIILAGRSDSAFTAQIGAMRMQQEIDAMRVLGLDPFDALVVPRVIACVLMTPLLTFIAMMAGLLGGMVALWAAIDITPGFFIARMNESIPISNFWVGMVKAPVFALVIAVIGCRHGMQVEGDVESLGSHVTSSVVQSLFAVIVIEAAFAILFFQLGV